MSEEAVVNLIARIEKLEAALLAQQKSVNQLKGMVFKRAKAKAP